MAALADPQASRARGTSGSQANASQSHKGRRQSRNKKGSDPFLELSDDASKPPEMPTMDDRDENGAVHSSLLAELVLTPINMISFLLSLFLVDHQQRQWRLSQHSSGSDSFWSSITHWRWLDPQPYQDPRDTWQRSSNTSGAQSADDSSFRGWFTRKKHRAMAKIELGDAFEMRGRVLIVIVVSMLLSLLAAAYALRRMYAWLST